MMSNSGWHTRKVANLCISRWFFLDKCWRRTLSISALHFKTLFNFYQSSSCSHKNLYNFLTLLGYFQLCKSYTVLLHIKTQWMNCSSDKALLFPLQKLPLTHCHPLPSVCHSPHVSFPHSRLLFRIITTRAHNACTASPSTHTVTHARIYLRWHLARDTCSHCSLYLQPLKRIFQLTYESLQKYVCEVTFGLKKSSVCAGSWKCQNISSRISSPVNFNFWSSGWRRCAVSHSALHCNRQ